MLLHLQVQVTTHRTLELLREQAIKPKPLLRRTGQLLGRDSIEVLGFPKPGYGLVVRALSTDLDINIQLILPPRE